MLSRIDLEEISNPNCKTGCNKKERAEITENSLCKHVVSISDNLPVRCVGEWAVDKIYLLVQYFGIFSNGMKNKWNTNYIEICSGPGRCVAREQGNEFNGTALSILKNAAFINLNKALFFDFDEEVIKTLNERIKKIDNTKSKAFVADYNNPDDLCSIIASEIDSKSLNLVFIDPTDCSVPFDLIKKIKQSFKSVDFIINIASGTDFNRNIKNVLLNQEQYSKTVTKYSNFLGTNEFFENQENIELAKHGENEKLRNKFRDSYKKSLEGLGYQHFGIKQIRHYYDILFASAHPKGIDFWNKACKIEIDGQRKLF